MAGQDVRTDIESVVEQDRAATDRSLNTERERADEVIEAAIEEKTEFRLEQTREKTEARLRAADEADDMWPPPPRGRPTGWRKPRPG
jgi:hypothetical protein